MEAPLSDAAAAYLAWSDAHVLARETVNHSATGGSRWSPALLPAFLTKLAATHQPGRRPPSIKSIKSQTRGERMFQDITDGTLECTICTDPFEAEAKIWSCGSCHHIYHLSCVKSWAVLFEGTIFTCPTCKSPRTRRELLEAKCWCGKILHRDIEAAGNTCGEVCGRFSFCTDRVTPRCAVQCTMICHPGPCEKPVCGPACPRNKQAANPTAMEAAAALGNPRRPTREDEERTARYETGGAHASNPGTSFFFLLVFQIPLLVWAVALIDKWAYPINHTKFIEHRSRLNLWLAVILGIIVMGGLNAIMSGTAVFAIWWKRFYQRRRGRSWIPGLLIITFFVVWILIFPFLYFGVPPIIWSAGMKRSCDGFETRVLMDDYYGGQASKLFPYKHDGSNHLKPPVYDTTKGGGNDTSAGFHSMDVAESFDVTVPLGAPFHFFYRVGTPGNENHPTADFDLQHNSWRLVNHRESSSTEGSGPDQCATQIKNGTWHQTLHLVEKYMRIHSKTIKISETAQEPYVRFPELNLVAPNFNRFTKDCRYNGFMMFFKTDGMDEKSIAKQAAEQWTSKSRNNVVLRTRTFVRPGLVINVENMEVCARKEDYQVKWKDGGSGLMKTMPGLGENWMIPMGLMAVMRQKKESHSDGNYKGCELFT